MKMLKSTAFVSLCFLLGGCATQSPQYLPNDTSMLELNTIAQKAQQSTAVLSEIQSHHAYRPPIRYNTYRYNKHPIYANASKMEAKRISINFTGPLDVALKQICMQAGYQYLQRLNGNTAMPVISLHESNTTVMGIIGKINSQLHSSVEVIAYPKTKSLLLIEKV